MTVRLHTLQCQHETRGEECTVKEVIEKDVQDQCDAEQARTGDGRHDRENEIDDDNNQGGREKVRTRRFDDQRKNSFDIDGRRSTVRA